MTPKMRRLATGIGLGLLIGLLFAIAHVKGVPLLRKWDLSTVDARYARFAEPEKVASDLLVVKIDNGTVAFMENGYGYSWPFDRTFYSTLASTLCRLGARAVIFDVTFHDLKESARIPLETRRVDPFAAPPAVAGEQYAPMTNRLMGQELWRCGRVAIAVDVGNEPSLTPAELEVRSGALLPAVPYLARTLVPVTGTPPAADAGGTGVTYLKFPEPNVLAGVRAIGNVAYEQTLDVDAKVRRFAPAVGVGEHRLADLAIAAVSLGRAGADPEGLPAWNLAAPPPADALPVRAPLPALAMRSGEAEIAGVTFPLLSDGTAWIRWRGAWEDAQSPLAAHTVPAWQVFALSGGAEIFGADLEANWEEAKRDATLVASTALHPSRVKGKLALVGFTLQGEYSDYLGTPFGNQPGVYKHAAAIDTLLTGDVLRSAPPSVDFALIVVLAVLSGALVLGAPEVAFLRRVPPVVLALSLPAPGVLLALSYAAAATFAFGRGWVVNVLPASIAAILTTLFSAAFAWFFTQREREAEQKRKEQFLELARAGLGAGVVDEILLKSPDLMPSPGGKRMNLTLYFSDIAGFTTISEKLSPEELVSVLNEYLARVSHLLETRHGAFLDKYIGDAVMCFWGAPMPSEDGPERACLAALDVMAFIDQFSAELIARGIPPLRTRIGINTGPAVAGFVGNPKRRAYYTALGDTVNLASRLEGANKAFGTTCMIGPQTFEGAKKAVLARELDLLKVKGKKTAVHVYELMGRQSDPLPTQREIKRRYEAALDLYRARDFEKARAEFQALLTEYGDPPSKTLLAACEERLKSPPEADWDGSNELHEK